MEEKKDSIKINDSGTPPTAYYLFKGTLWKQDQLEYGEAQELMKMPLLQNLDGMKIDFEHGINGMIDAVLKSDIGAIIANLRLRPCESNLWQYVKNRYYARKNKVDRLNIAKSLKLSEMKKVLQDFFYFNFALIMSADGSEIISDLAKMISQQQISLTPSEPRKETTVL